MTRRSEIKPTCDGCGRDIKTTGFSIQVTAKTWKHYSFCQFCKDTFDLSVKQYFKEHIVRSERKANLIMGRICVGFVVGKVGARKRMLM